MPELPEIETLKLSLEKHLIGKSIKEVEINRHNLRYLLANDLRPRLIKSRILRLSRRAKYLIIELDNANSLVVHLGMSGRFTLQPNHYTLKKHDHVIIHLDNDEYLVFNDARRFGMIEIIKSNMLPDSKSFKNLGYEPLSNEFNSRYLYDKINTRKIPIKNALMNNNIVVGIGNIYASESLFLAKVNPLKLSNSLTMQHIEAIVKCCKHVLQQAIKAGGTTLKDFVSGDNKPGYFKQQLLIYGCAGKQCTNCNDIILKVKQQGRASFYCPTCQKIDE
jgi:formamidopyrimidine-DNA glycosylase